MVARGAMGNPWIFREISQAFKIGEDIMNTAIEKMNMCINHFKFGR